MLFNFWPGKKTGRRNSRIHSWRYVRAFLEVLEDRCLPSTFLVTNNGDNGGVNPLPHAGTGTLRQAIIDADADPNLGITDSINFDMPGGVQTIQPLSQLPYITRPMVLDATTQPGYDPATGQPLIELNGAAAPSYAVGLPIYANGCTIKGFDVNSFGNTGIYINGNNNVIQANYVGTDVAGTSPRGNGTGVYVGGANNLIGNDVGYPGGNLVSGNTSGVFIFGQAATGNMLEGNRIGWGATGSALANTNDGVVISQASGNWIGRLDTSSYIPVAAGNAIANNGGFGVNITQASNNNYVEDNYITNNSQGGVHIHLSSSGNHIGAAPVLGNDPLPSLANHFINSGVFQGNIISGNQGNGVLIEDVGSTNNLVQGNYIGIDPTGTAPQPNTGNGVDINGASGNTIGGASFMTYYFGIPYLEGAGNVISGNGYAGVEINQATNINVQGNFIGTSVHGQALSGTSNADGVVLFNGAFGNQIGGPSSLDASGGLMGLGNVISGNQGDGVYLADFGSAALHVTGNQFQGNFIGTDVTGTVPVANGGDGILINVGANNNTVGGADTNAAGSPLAGAGNVISGNTLFGVRILGSGANNNWVAGNYIGVDVSGEVRLANGGGVGLFDQAQFNIIGTNGDGVNDAAERNVISGNGSDAVAGQIGFAPDNVDIYGTGTTHNVVAGNFIGTDAGGTVALPGIDQSGVFIGNGAQSNRIGVNPTDPGAAFERNLISGNGGDGVFILNTGTNYNVIAGNYIGTDPSGTQAVFNGSAGVLIAGGSYNVVGGATPLERNVLIANNTFGIDIRDNSDNTLPVNGNQVLNNYIGVDATGARALGTTTIGISVRSSNLPVTGTIIGLPGAGNVISGTSGDGIVLNGVYVTGTVIQANYIGTDKTGSTATGTDGNPLGNGWDGIVIAAGANNNIVGGTGAGQGNVISGNGGNGVELAGGGTTNNLLAGNFIGTDRTGTTSTTALGQPLGNAANGVLVDDGASYNSIGGSTPGAGNVISGNRANGVLITNQGGAVAGSLTLTAAARTAGFTLSTFATGFSDRGDTLGPVGMSFPASGGVVVSDALGNVRRFPTDADGQDALFYPPVPGVSGGAYGFNNVSGIALLDNTLYITRAQSNGLAQINDDGSLNQNLAFTNSIIDADGIVADPNNGVNGTLFVSAYNGSIYQVDPVAQMVSVFATLHADGLAFDSTSNILYAVGYGDPVSDQHIIGFDATSGAQVFDSGVIPGKPDGVVVGTGALAGKLIVNTNAGTVVEVDLTTKAQTVLATGGTRGDFTTADANNGTFFLTQSNLIARLIPPGASFQSYPNTTGNLVQGNFIGTDKTGTTAIGTDSKSLGNAFDGVLIQGGANGNEIGGADTNASGSPLAGAGNVISGNTVFGVEITGSGTNNNWIAGNFIGVDVTGKVRLANGGGVGIHGGAQDNTVGTNGDGTNDPAERNVISGNGTSAAGGIVGFAPDNVDIYQNDTADNVVAGNYIGTDATGTVALPGISQSGVFIGYGAHDNRIGVLSTDPGAVFEGNLISGNFGNGVLILNTGTDNNVIAGNYIGTDVTGTRALPNAVTNNPPNGTSYGAVFIGGGSNNTVGGMTTSERNVIIANHTVGVWVLDEPGNTLPVSGNKVLNNYIGVDVTGTHTVGSTIIGVAVQATGNQPVTDTIVGTPGAGNVISGNSVEGIDITGPGVTSTTVQANYIGTDYTGMVSLPNGDGVLIKNGANNNTVGGTTTGQANIISGNAANGVHITGATTNNDIVEGNLIGTDATGHNPLGNANDGVLIDAGANTNTIGGSSTITFGVGLAGPGNVISGNLNAGVVVSEASNNNVQGNFIGIDLAGKVALPNDPSGTRGDGVDLLDGTSNNIIGGLFIAIDANGNLQGYGNVISGNGLDGVGIAAAPDGGNGAAMSNYVEGNFIGTDPSGTRAIPNQANGVQIRGDAQTNYIGNPGDPSALRNLISGNRNAGVRIDGSAAGTGANLASANLVVGNYIGTDQSGTTATGSDGKPLGNGTEGVLLDNGAMNNTVGGTAAGAGNVISGNAANGVHITGATTNNNAVEQNLIGTDYTGAVALGNANDGVLIDAGAYTNTIGGTMAGAGNVISANLNAGVVISLSPPTPTPPPPGNFVLQNFIGTDLSGSKITGTNGLPLGNRGDGVLIVNSAGNSIGGNTISGNAANGVHLTGAAATLNQVEGNEIGTDSGSTMPLGNGNDGVLIDAGANVNTVGGAAGGSRNVISGNLNTGIGISQASSNQIQGNFIGTDERGMHAVKNATDGVVLWNGATNNTIGGMVAADENLISGNGTNGVRITGTGTTTNLVVGNFIGTNATGVGPLGNSSNGVRIEAGASGNTIGGPSLVDGNTRDLKVSGNVISGNLQAGVDISGAAANFVQGNFIGTDLTGTTGSSGSIPLGNHTDGVLLEAGASNNTIGGSQGTVGSASAPWTGNLISANIGANVEVTGNGTNQNSVAGNFIGIDATGKTRLGTSGSAGILIQGGAQANVIGADGTAASSNEGNVISGNGGGLIPNRSDGAGYDNIDIFGAGTNGNVVAGNKIGTDVTGTVAVGSSGGADGVFLWALNDATGPQNTRIGVNSYDAGSAAEKNIIAGNPGSGIEIAAGVQYTTVAGNVISDNSLDGVAIHGVGADHNTLSGTNLIGTNAAGTGIWPNERHGVAIYSGASFNTVESSVISGNVLSGVVIADVAGDTVATAGNQLLSNYIGVDLSGSNPLSNGTGGVLIQSVSVGVTGTTIGAPGSGNVISGNDGPGVLIQGAGASGTMVQGNEIGVFVSAGGTAPVRNTSDGVIIQQGAVGNTIGGTAAGAGNVISGNGGNGVNITGDGTSGNFVQGNLIGTDATGGHSLGNQGDGVVLDAAASGNTIGGTSFVDDNNNLAGAGNVIFGSYAGVYIWKATDNSVQGNFIGTDRTGKSPLGEAYGITLYEGADDNQIGGASSIDGRGNLTGLGNLISGNSGDGIFMGSRTSATLQVTGNHVEGNFIGTDRTGTTAVANGGDGVLLDGGAIGNVIGGTAAGTRNIISGNGVAGTPFSAGAAVEISVEFDSGPIENNLVENNYIGTDVTGLHALGNLNEGVMIQKGAQNNQIGAAGAGNLIYGNIDGIIVSDSGTTGNVLEANTVGLLADGTAPAIPSGIGVVIRNGATDNQIGTSGAGNVISGNVDGIDLTDSGTIGNRVQGNYIGTDATGTLARGNIDVGIRITTSASGNQKGNQIGGAGQGNVISANGSVEYFNSHGYTGGIVLDSTTNNVLEDNLIGTDASGTKPLGNYYAGVLIQNGASGNFIRRGVTGNVISASVPVSVASGSGTINESFGVLITGSATQNNVTQNNVVTGNLIGTDLTGTQALGGQYDGVEIANGALFNQIGAAGEPNIISGNTNAGVEVTGQNTANDEVFGNLIGTDVTGTVELGNGAYGVSIDQGASSISVDGRNIISGNLQGVAVDGSGSQANVLSNYIGTDITGSHALGNNYGVEIGAGASAYVESNVISGSFWGGVVFGGGTAVVNGNLLGTDATGEHMLGNYYGVYAALASSPATLTVSGNTISGNGSAGIFLLGNFTQATIQGNLIGTDAAGTSPLANPGYGIYMRDATNVQVGGTGPGAANVIAANDLGGISVDDTQVSGAANIVIQGNSIGTDLHDTIPLGNGGDGISIENSSGNTIGGGVGASNFIDFNHGNGIALSGTSAQGNSIIGNFIGTDMDGTADQGNLLAGIRFDTGANGNYVTTNHSSFNGRQGVVLEPDAGTGNELFDNSITGNALGGIDLKDDGPSLNTPGGPHSGPNSPNDMQNYPVITSAAAADGQTVIQVSLNSTPGRNFYLQLFANDSLDANGYAQGETILTGGGNQTFIGVHTDATGNVTTTITFPTYLKGKYITATAIDATSGDTSEFSKPVLVGTLAPVINPLGPLQTPTEGLAQSIAVTGTYFEPGATVLLNGAPLATTFTSDTQLSASIPAGVTEEGVNEVVTVVNPAPDSATSNAVTFAVADAPLTLNPLPQTMTEGLSFTQTVATFTDAGGLETPDHYRATIYWGDGSSSDEEGSSSDGVIKLIDPNTDSVFGTHTYLEEGTYTATVFVRDDGGSDAETTETITVTDAPLTAEPATAAFIEGTPATGSNGAGPVIATFTDADPHGYPGLYTATIDWKDAPSGQPADITTGTVVADGAGFDVLGTHTYTQAHNGPYTYHPVVTITDAGGASTQVTNSNANVSPPPIQAAGRTFAVLANASNNYTVASFSDPDLRTDPGKFVATITWDDSTAASPDVTTGTITAVSSQPGSFTVSAKHAFAPFTPANATHTISITISDAPGGEGRSVTVVDRVVDPPSQDKNAPFVFQLYQDLLGRAPTDAELSRYTGLMHHGTSARQVAADLMHGLEYRTIEVQAVYHTYLQRAPSTTELSAGTHFLATGGTVEKLQTQLVLSPEYWQLQGGTAAGFIDGLYQEALGHAPAAVTLAGSTHGFHPGRLAAAVFASAEYRRDLIQNDYAQFLYQAADQKTLAAYARAFANGGRDEDVLADILGSAAYRALL